MPPTDPDAASPFGNHDMAPVPPPARTWRARDMAALWVSMAACIPTYTLASSLIEGGMTWWQAVLTIFLGNVIVLLPMVLNAHAGTKYGIPFPVYCRAAFGIRGANVPALVRAFVACGWFGIQTWIGGDAVYTILTVFDPGLGSAPPAQLLGLDLGINVAQLVCFLGFWAVNVVVILRGIETIRLLLNVKAPLLVGLGLLLLGWAYFEAGGFGPILSQPDTLEGPAFWAFFAAGLTANVSFWATLSLNIPDFSRYARSQRAQVIGQAAGLPTTMALYSFIGVAVTSATFVIYGHTIWDPVKLLAGFQNKAVLVLAMFALCLATLATNIAANVVSPANDFAHLAPRWVGFKAGGVITAVIGVLIMPWKLYADPSGYIFTWLIGVSTLLGSAGGVLAVDYLVVRRMRLDLDGLYRRNGPYWYAGGFNPVGLFAMAAGVALCVPGFVEVVTRPPGEKPADTIWKHLYDFAWFVSFGVSAVVYLIGTAARGLRR